VESSNQTLIHRIVDCGNHGDIALNEPVTSVFQRAVAGVRRAWQAISQEDWRVLDHVRPDLPDRDIQTLRRRVEECISGRGGEVSSRSRAAAIGHAYLGLDDEGRRRFLGLLADEFGVDTEAVSGSIDGIRSRIDPVADAETLDRLREQLTPRYLKLLTQFNSLPSGVKFLVDLRADMVRYGGSDPRLRPLESNLGRLLTSWFDIGFLELKRITWASQAALLERLIAYEAVHEIESWADMKRRVSEDRRCYAFFHPGMPDEPLIFVEVALVRGMSASIQELLGGEGTNAGSGSADTAVFYSISNTQDGLRGVSLGTFLIKRVVDELRRELPGLRSFVTLSPIPGFGRFLNAMESAPPAERSAGWAALEAALHTHGISSVAALLVESGWHRNAELVQAVETPLVRLAAYYLLEVRNRGRALDPVANFHLNNGARVERLNWLANVSPAGMERSAGIMVNYRYEPDRIESNHEAYRTNGTVAASAGVQALLKAD
jgi:malonyl-CoA decarboxylase